MLLLSSLLLLVSAVAVDGYPCPCVPDYVKFQFDFQWGCNHPPTASDFTSSSSCNIAGKPRASSIKKVIMHDLMLEGEEEGKEEVWMNTTALLTETIGEDGAAKYTFTYNRPKKSPTKLWFDFYTTSSARGDPVATIDLNYQRGSDDCFHDSNPVFYPGDFIYFLTVESVGHISDPFCSYGDERAETNTQNWFDGSVAEALKGLLA
ncbi:expressed unknown protein [Seminavis robusta]|uniref:Uncharacterized protein n=1 Tax=Seminavis robusta TaxID=568900 RepID=A0A9N8D7N9_9STRA|nr:expressed unknown protein [Seminavis robusta]|eukprot:Sro31_g020180.1 n/a (206) ;mRNA; f:59210-59938